MRRPDKDAFHLRQALQGGLDFSALPAHLRGLFQSMQRQMMRRHNRTIKREAKALAYRAAALAGGGTREISRRAFQIEFALLQVSP